jgi:hypothetical protein
MDITEGARSDADKAAAIESYLKRNFSYSLTGMIHQRADPVTWFLLHERRGHCEYFAGAMVAMLTDLGVPARMVAGFSGGSLSADGEEASIRDANAHAWVEAWVGDDEAWTVFDPTPEADIPALNRPTGRERFRWAVRIAQSNFLESPAVGRHHSRCLGSPVVAGEAPACTVAPLRAEGDRTGRDRGGSNRPPARKNGCRCAASRHHPVDRQEGARSVARRRLGDRRAFVARRTRALRGGAAGVFGWGDGSLAVAASPAGHAAAGCLE